ncbi:MAG TPA: recombinase RecT [Propionibacteriaceae bacterium]
MTSIVQARQQQDRPSLATIVQRMQPEIARALPKHMDADRMARLALTVLRQTPKLADCTPESFAGALLTAAALGLEPGINGEAYLVPHGRECSLIVGYQGLTKLYFQHPDAQHLDAQAVYENDDFDYAYGLDPFLRHKPALGDRGKVVLYYAVASLKSGSRLFVVVTPEEVKALRGGKVGTSGSIPDPMHWMERKTVLKQVLKLLPKSTTLAQAVQVDERNGSELVSQRVPEQITAGPAEVVDTATGEILDAPSDEWPATAAVAK